MKFEFNLKCSVVCINSSILYDSLLYCNTEYRTSESPLFANNKEAKLVIHNLIKPLAPCLITNDNIMLYFL